MRAGDKLTSAVCASVQQSRVKQKPKKVLKTTDSYQGNSRSLSDQGPSLEHKIINQNCETSWKAENSQKQKLLLPKKTPKNLKPQMPNEEIQLSHTVKANAVDPVLLIFLQQNYCNWLGKQPTQKMPLCF